MARIIKLQIQKKMTLKDLLKRFTPDKEKILRGNSIRFFSNYLHDPHIWHFHRRSVATGAGVGIFCAFIPLPIQTLSAIALAILFRVNLPISILFSLVSNPLTIPFIFLSSYKAGLMILGIEGSDIEQIIHSNATIFEWFSNKFIHIWEPFVIGCFALGLICSILTYLLIRLIWRFATIKKWDDRRKNKNTL